MRNYGRRRPSYRARANTSFWLSFSDLMSALVLVFVLVLFYSIYQYTTTVSELLYKQSLLDAQSGELVDRAAQLEEKDKELALIDEQLKASQIELTTQEERLLLAARQNEATEKLLAERESELNDALSQLEDAKALLDTQVAQLNLQQEQMASQQEQLEALVGVRARIIASLAQALSDAKISATVDSGGAIRIDESVMFDFASSVLKDSGKAMLNRFIPVYASVLFSEENQGSVSEILIEGHTDRVGSYMSNLKLSQERATAVMDYIMSAENTSIDASMKELLTTKIKTVGCSYSYPAKDASGNISDDASRRVEFKFRMQDEKMVESMRQILEGMSAQPAD